MTQFTEKQPAKSDATGAISFTMTTAPPGLVFTGSLSIPSAPSGAFFHCTAADDDWGTWAGPALHNPVQSNQQVPLVVTGTGLLPNTQYVCIFAGTQQPDGFEPAVWPTTALTTPFATTTLQDGNTAPIAASGVATFGPYPSQGFASLRLTINNPDNLLQYNVAITWTDAHSNTVGSQTFAISGFQGSIAQTQQPHKGDFVTVSVQNIGGHAGSPFLYLANTTELAAYWVGDSFSEGTVWESLPVGAGVTSTLLFPSLIFAGPASLFVNAGGAATWHITVHATLLTGSDAQLYRIGNGDAGFTSGEGTTMVMLPPAPIHVDFTNGSGGSVTPVLGLYMDTWRVG